MSDITLLRIGIAIAGLILIGAIIFFGRPRKQEQGKRVPRPSIADAFAPRAEPTLAQAPVDVPVDNYDDLTVSDVASAVQKLTDAGALTALLRYEQNHKDRAGAVTGIENRLAALAAQDIGRN